MRAEKYLGPKSSRGDRYAFVAWLVIFFASKALAQDFLKTLPAYERYQKVTRELTNAVSTGPRSVTWKGGGKAVEYQFEAKRFRYDIESAKLTELGSATARETNQEPAEVRREGRRNRQERGRPARGRQSTSAISPDGKLKAFYRDRNMWLSDTNGENEKAITTEGNEKTRIKYGTASWVYGEELDQTTAMWWSTNSQKLAFYRFDESQVADYYLTLNQTNIQDKLSVEPYTKAGATNPLVDLIIYDLASKCTVQVDVRKGEPFDNETIGHYIYGISWSPDGKELLFHRTNRRQNIMELCAADGESGKCRVVVHEEWLPSWVENSPTMKFLKDGKRFIWASERTGWRNFYLYDLGRTNIVTLTGHSCEVAELERVDEEAGLLYYTARSGDNPLKLQLHCVGLDGAADRRLTDPAFDHTINFAPDGKHFLDTAQTHDLPSTTRLMDAEGKEIAELAKANLARFNQLGLKRVELLCFKAADGQTDLYGMLHFPSNFQPYKKYPLLVTVYAGPATSAGRETFTLPNPITELGFLVASFDSRSANGRGKRALDAIYSHFGQVEIDDQAAAVRWLEHRRYIDHHRVGIFGTSYGGTASSMCLLRYPDVFAAACSSSPVTDFRNYDTIYAERYLWLPQENKAAYDNASLLTHVSALKGHLMLYYGTADDNVHPSNAMQFIKALQRAGKSFELQAGPDLGHGSVNRERMMEFFIKNLAVK
jgi:dipeptidyl-peptidase-4